MRAVNTVQPSYLAPDPAESSYQLLENIATGYWYSQVLFSALELDVFSALDGGGRTSAALAAFLHCRADELHRLLRALAEMNLVCRHDDLWMNGSATSLHLVRGKSGYMGDFLLYRQYMQENWGKLTEKIMGRDQSRPEYDYRERNFHYVRAMDRLVRQKACEIVELCFPNGSLGPILDVGGGAGSLLRAIRENQTAAGVEGAAFDGELFDLAEVGEAARRLYPEKDDWRGIAVSAGDFRNHHFSRRYGCIIFSNFLHAYAAQEARELLEKALNLLADGGGIVIHDYFPDFSPAVPEKGALYDLCMMQNTYNGCCHEMQTIREWLSKCGRGTVKVSSVGLASDSALMLIGGPDEWHSRLPLRLSLCRELGFDRASVIAPAEVVTAPWVAQKCRFGCCGFGRNLQCPPNSPSHDETREILDGYTTAVLVQGQPPGKTFHEQLLELERRVFLAGYHKALVYGAGPCTLCSTCLVEDGCRQPGKARPSMEACGIDVYGTVRKIGWELRVVPDRSSFVKYIGLLLVE